MSEFTGWFDCAKEAMEKLKLAICYDSQPFKGSSAPSSKISSYETYIPLPEDYVLHLYSKKYSNRLIRFSAKIYKNDALVKRGLKRCLHFIISKWF